MSDDGHGEDFERGRLVSAMRRTLRATAFMVLRQDGKGLALATCGLDSPDSAVHWELVRREKAVTLSRTGPKWCKSASCCLAHCSPLKRAAYAELLRDGLRAWTVDDFRSAAFVTLTMRHEGHDPIGAVLETVAGAHAGRDGKRVAGRHGAWQLMQQDRAFRAWKLRHSVAGFFCVLEVVWSAQNGWHVHRHVLLLLERPWMADGCTAAVAGRVEDAAGWELADLWVSAVGRAGGYAENRPYRDRLTGKVRGAQHSRQVQGPEAVAAYLAKVAVSEPEGGRTWDIADELTSVSKKGQFGGLAPTGLLHLAAGHPAGDWIAQVTHQAWGLDCSTADGRAKATGLLADWIRAFRGRRCLQASRDFWRLLRVSRQALEAAEGEALLSESADVVHGGGVLERVGLLSAVLADVVSAPLEPSVLAAERACRRELREAETEAEIAAAAGRFIDRVGSVVDCERLWRPT